MLATRKIRAPGSPQRRPAAEAGGRTTPRGWQHAAARLARPALSLAGKASPCSPRRRGPMSTTTDTKEVAVGSHVLRVSVRPGRQGRRSMLGPAAAHGTPVSPLLIYMKYSHQEYLHAPSDALV